MPRPSEDILARLQVLEGKVEHITPLSNKFPSYVVLTLMLQTFGAIWWASDISNTVNTLKTQNVSEVVVKNYIAEREKAYLEMDNTRHTKMVERVTKIEGSFTHIEKSLTRIEKKLMLLNK